MNINLNGKPNRGPYEQPHVCQSICVFTIYLVQIQGEPGACPKYKMPFHSAIYF